MYHPAGNAVFVQLRFLDVELSAFLYFNGRADIGDVKAIGGGKVRRGVAKFLFDRD